ncbi:MAG TPA: PGPGW domain-containing protein [Actinomycetes bacterium]|nr:PGPGW domain-containing protein [Actinomycetes bacterium]
MTRVPDHDTPDAPPNTPDPPADVGTAERPPRFRRLRAARERARQRRALDLTWRVVVFMVGTAVIGAGIAGLILPALPGWVLIIVGLGLLATEFAWAERLLDRVKDRVGAVTDAALDPAKRRRLIVLTIVVLALVAAFAWWYLATYGTRLPF